MSKRLTKEYKIDACDSINVKYGTVNKDNPQVIYISGSCWISPTIDGIDYDDMILNFKKTIRKSIKRNFTNSSMFDERFIFDFDTMLHGATANDRKYMDFDIYLKQRPENVLGIKDLSSVIKDRMGNISSDMVGFLNSYKFTVNKRKK